MSKPVKDGGQALPGAALPYGEEHRFVRDSGMTLRDYFAAHAPASPQPWFRPEMPPQPERIYPHKKCMNACCKLPMNASEREAWVLEKERQLYVQWPYAWADAMLAERDRAKVNAIETVRALKTGGEG